MKCPFCQGDMLAGCFNSAGMGASGSVYWLPLSFCNKNSFPPVSRASIENEGGFWMTSGFSLVSKPDTVYYCKSCHKVVADVPDAPTMKRE